MKATAAADYMLQHSVILQWRTVRHLKPGQFVFFLLRRFLPFRRITVSNSPPARRLIFGQPPCSVSGIGVDDSTFRFLNVSINLRDGSGKFNWTKDLGKRLWNYNLHYFDYLREVERSFNNKDQLIDSWIAQNPQVTQPGWEPYTTSLRIVNWLFYLQLRPSDDIPSAWRDSLYLQGRWLEKNDERHILATHYFENLKAFLFLGCFFDGDDAGRWRKRALKEIRVQLREQMLSDGGHYERSTQYHCRMLENYLDIINLGQSRPDLCPLEFITDVRAIAELGVQYLKGILFPDGTPPLFNDSVLNISPSPAELIAYAERLGINANREGGGQSDLINFPDSGLFGCRTANDMILIDCGHIGPAYQPGHSHCDFLSYEMMIANRRIVVDTGVCEYEPGELRLYVRSTKAHNTVVIDGGEQSEIWGEFRIARRARKLFANITKVQNVVEFTGAFRGFYSVRGQIEHQRTVTVAMRTDGRAFEKLSVTDRLHGRGHHIAESFVHFHPDMTLEPAPSGEINLLESGSLVAVILNRGGQEVRIESGVYCPEFGKQVPNQVLVFRSQGPMPLTLGYDIEIILR